MAIFDPSEGIESKNTPDRDGDYGEQYNSLYTQVKLSTKGLFLIDSNPNMEALEDAVKNPKIFGIIPVGNWFISQEERETAWKATQEGTLDAFLEEGQVPPEGLKEAVEANLAEINGPLSVPNNTKSSNKERQ